MPLLMDMLLFGKTATADIPPSIKSLCLDLDLGQLEHLFLRFGWLRYNVKQVKVMAMIELFQISSIGLLKASSSLFISISIWLTIAETQVPQY